MGGRPPAGVQAPAPRGRPQAHLLAHPALPEMLGRLSARSSVGDAALRHAEELRRIGFSRDWLRWVSKDRPGSLGKFRNHFGSSHFGALGPP